jgi:hypothetical protein
MSWGIKAVKSLSTPGRTVAEVASQTSLLMVDVGGPLGPALDARLVELTGRRFRRLGRFIQLALSGAVEAAYAVKQKLPPRRTGVFLATGLGNLSDLMPFSHAVFGDPGFHVSAIQFANSVGNAGAFYIAQALGSTGPVLAVSQDEVSFEAALLQATSLLDSHDIDFALVGAVDVVMPPVQDHLARMGFGPDSPLNLSEGSAWWVLGRSEANDFATLESVTLETEDSLEAGVFAARTYDVGTLYAKSGLYPTLFLEEAQAGESLEVTARTREGLTGRVTVRKGAAS